MTAPEPPFCEDCRWFQHFAIGNYCNSPQRPYSFSRVTRDLRAVNLCVDARLDGGWCGHQAAWFEPKPEPKTPQRRWWHALPWFEP